MKCQSLICDVDWKNTLDPERVIFQTTVSGNMLFLLSQVP